MEPLPVKPENTDQPGNTLSDVASVSIDRRKYLRIAIWAFLLLVILSGIAITVGKMRKTTPPEALPAVPEPTATPTPIRPLSPIATTSAFTGLEATVSSLSASLEAYDPRDPSLTPPSLELELGLKE